MGDAHLVDDFAARGGRALRLLFVGAVAIGALLILSVPAGAAQPRSYYELTVLVNDQASPSMVIAFLLTSPFDGSNPHTAAKWVNLTATLGAELSPTAIQNGTCGGGVCAASKSDVNGPTSFALDAEISQAALDEIAANPGAPYFANMTVTIEYTDADGFRPRTIQRTLTLQLNYRPPAAVGLGPAALAGLGGAGAIGLVLYAGGRARLEELYLMHDSGLLIRHWTRKNGSVHDSDIMSGMFIVLQEFVRDSFADRHNTLERLRFGREQVVMVRGERTWLAAVVRGRYLNGLPRKLHAAVRDFEAHYGSVLQGWDGNVGLFPSVDIVALRFMKGRPSGAAG